MTPPSRPTLIGPLPAAWRPTVAQVLWAVAGWPVCAAVGILAVMVSPEWATWPVSAVCWVAMWGVTDRAARGFSWGARWVAMVVAGAGWWALSLILGLVAGDGFGHEPALFFRAISATVAVVPVFAHATATCWAAVSAVRSGRSPLV